MHFTLFVLIKDTVSIHIILSKHCFNFCFSITTAWKIICLWKAISHCEFQITIPDPLFNDMYVERRFKKQILIIFFQHKYKEGLIIIQEDTTIWKRPKPPSDPLMNHLFWHLRLQILTPFIEVKTSVIVDVSGLKCLLDVDNLVALNVQFLQHFLVALYKQWNNGWSVIYLIRYFIQQRSTEINLPGFSHRQ